MQTGQQGRCALALSIRSLMRAAGWCFPALLLAVMCFGVLSPAHAAHHAVHKVQATAKTTPRIEMLSKATLGKLLKMGSPSAQHRLLSSLRGKWAFTLKYWDKKGATPQISMGTATNQMILGGRFLFSKMDLMLNFGGQVMPYEGWNFLGYDTVTKTFTSVLMDTMRTGMATGTAHYNAKLKMLEERGHFTHPLMDKERTYRAELQLTGDDTYKRELFITDASGKEFKVLEIDFHRPR